MLDTIKLNRLLSGLNNPLQTYLLIISGILTLTILAGIIFIFQDFQYAVLLYSIPISLLFLYLIFYNPRIWLYIIGLLVFLFTKNSYGEAGLLDFIMGSIYVVSTFVWIFFTVFIKKEKIVNNFTDFLILLFLILGLLNFFILILNNGEAYHWFKSYILFNTLLLYFPIKHLLTEKKHLIIFLTCFGFSMVIANLMQYYSYYTNIYTELMYVYQYGKGISGNQTLYTSACIIFFSYILFQKKLKFQAVLIIIFGMSFISFISSFSRTFWIIFAFEVILMLIYVPNKIKIKLILYVSISVIIFSSVVFLLYKDKTEFIYTYIEKRILSSSEGKSDPSVLGRFYEYSGVLNEIENYPLGGSGMSSTFSYYSPLGLRNYDANFTHNGYLLMSYMFGIPMAFLFILPIFINLIKSQFIIFALKDNIYKPLVLSGFFIILLFIMADFSTALFVMRDGILMLSIAYGFISIGESEAKKIKDKSLYKLPKLISN